MRPFRQKSLKHDLMTFQYFLLDLDPFRPELVLELGYIKGKVSTDRSDEAKASPGSTLSYVIV